MPGYFFSDLGDMIRSMACSLDENNTDFENITIRKDFYTPIVEGYLSVMEKQFTASEKKIYSLCRHYNYLHAGFAVYD